MKTPIYDFVKKYSDSGVTRFHMPGHKGIGPLGFEALDITEISGADTLYSSDGIIEESEAYASSLFGTKKTFYSTEGSTLAIRAMLATALSNVENGERRKTVLAARGAHKAFVTAAALIDFDIEWIYPEGAHVASCNISARDVRAALDGGKKFDAVYITSPDYLGNILPIEEISAVCRKFGVPLLVDNAHGAYLAYLMPSRHPIALGADMCCDSAHKTLPVLTGGAYLHISESMSEYIQRARAMLSLFASTSPSYLILESLDLCNKYIAEGYPERLAEAVSKIASVKKKIEACGLKLCGEEPLKIVISPRSFGYTGSQLSEYLRSRGIEVEFADGEYTVLMATPENTDDDFSRLVQAVEELKGKTPLSEISPEISRATTRKMTVREAMFRASEKVNIDSALGRVVAVPTVSCPPAVPIAISGEQIDERIIGLCKTYGINEIEVVK